LSHFGFDLISNLNWSDISISILAIERDDQEQGFYRGLPFIEMLLGLRQILDIVDRGAGEWDRRRPASTQVGFVICRQP